MSYEMTLVNLTTEQFIHLVDLCTFRRISQAKANLSKIKLTTNYLSDKQILWELRVAHRGSSESTLFEGWFEPGDGFKACVTITTFEKKKIVHTQGGWIPIGEIYQYLRDRGYYEKHNEPPAINPQLSSERDTTLLDQDYSRETVFENKCHIKTNYTDELLAMVFLLLDIIYFVIKLYKAIKQSAAIRKSGYLQFGIATCTCRYCNINEAAIWR